MIRIDAVWLAVQPMDMRAGAERLLASVVTVFGAAQAHHGYLFANARHTRIKLSEGSNASLDGQLRKRRHQAEFPLPLAVLVASIDSFALILLP